MKQNGYIDDGAETELTYTTRQRNDDWLISYSDLVTVLLCFFIMFFVIKAREQEKNFQAMLKSPKKDQKALISMTAELNASLQNQKLNLKTFDNHLAMDISSSIFEPQSDNLTLDGKYLFTQLAGIAFKYMPSIQLQLSIGSEGNTIDGLSLKRINHVRNYLVGLGIQQELVAVGSFTKKEIDNGEHVTDQVKIFISKNYNVSEQ